MFVMYNLRRSVIGEADIDRNKSTEQCVCGSLVCCDGREMKPTHTKPTHEKRFIDYTLFILSL